MSGTSYFTQAGLDQLKQELTDLKTRGRAEMAKAIQEARDKGDLSDNAEHSPVHFRALQYAFPRGLAQDRKSVV